MHVYLHQPFYFYNFQVNKKVKAPISNDQRSLRVSMINLIILLFSGYCVECPTLSPLSTPQMSFRATHPVYW